MSYNINATSVPQQIGTVSSTALNPIGLRVLATDATYGGGEFIYLKGVASTALGSVVTYNPYTGVTTLADGSAIGPVAVATAATVANTYGWYQISGVAVVKSATAVANSAVYTTATAGTVDDAVTAGDRIQGALYLTADGTPSAGLALLAIERPFNYNGATA